MPRAWFSCVWMGISQHAASRLNGRGARSRTRWGGPLTGQALGSRLARPRDQVLQIGRIVHVYCDSRQFPHDAGPARSLRRGIVWLEAVVAEAQREQAGGAAEGGVGTAAV